MRCGTLAPERKAVATVDWNAASGLTVKQWRGLQASVNAAYGRWLKRRGLPRGTFKGGSFGAKTKPESE